MAGWLQDVPEPILSDKTQTDMLSDGQARFPLSPFVSFRCTTLRFFIPRSSSNCAQCLHSLFGPQFIPGGKRMAGIKADTNPFRLSIPSMITPYMLKTAPDTVLLSCGVL